MKSSILIGLLLASISFGVALAAEDNMTMLINESTSANITPDNLPVSVIISPSDNMTISENMTMSDNMTMPCCMKMPMNMPMNMSMPMSMNAADVPTNIVMLQNVTVNIITIQPPNMSNA